MKNVLYKLRPLALAALASLPATSAWASPVVIDNFNVPNPSSFLTLTAGAPTVKTVSRTDTDGANILGATRDLTFSRSAGTQRADAEVAYDDGVGNLGLSIFSAGNPDTQLVARWDGAAAGPTLGDNLGGANPFVGVDLTNGGVNDALGLTILSASPTFNAASPILIEFLVRSYAGGNYLTYTFSHSIISAINSPTPQYFFFANAVNAVPGFDWTNVTGVEMRITSVSGSDIIVDSLEATLATPAPSTLVCLMLGAATVMLAPMSRRWLGATA